MNDERERAEFDKWVAEWLKDIAPELAKPYKDHAWPGWQARAALAATPTPAQAPAQPLTDEQFCDIATHHFPRWREDIQETFVTQLGRHIEREVRAVIAAAPVEQANPFDLDMMKRLNKRECDDADAILRALCLDPETYRTEGGNLNLPKIRAAIAHPDEYPRTAQTPAQPLGFIDEQSLKQLHDEEWLALRGQAVMLWGTNNPPSRAIVPVYAAPPHPLAGLDADESVDPEDLIGQFASAHLAWNKSPMENDIRERYRNASAALYAKLAAAPPQAAQAPAQPVDAAATKALMTWRTARKPVGPYLIALDDAMFNLENALAAAPPQAAAQAPAVTAKPIVWKQDNANQWSESDYGFYITLDTDEDRDADNPYFAAWGEGDEDRFDSLEAAQRWCQDKINSYFREYAVVHGAPAQGKP